MRKIRLRVEDLAIEGFATAGTRTAAGTVRAHSGDYQCATAYGAYTCDGYYSCDRWVECLATVVDNTCPGVNYC